MSVDPSEPESYQEDDAAELPSEAPEADAAEQSRVVPLDEDEYT